jgi:predicted permease
MYSSAKNLRLAGRQLRRAPGFAVTVVLVLTLGIGATTAMFSVVEGVLLRPLPFRDADRLVRLGDHLGGRPGISVTAGEIDTYARSASAFSSLGGYINASYELSGGERPKEVRATRMTASTLATLGVSAAAGRVFTAQEEDAREPLAILSYALWVQRYDRDPRAIGSLIVLDRKTYTVIGVMPRGFDFPTNTSRLEQTQLWLPLRLTAEELSEEHAGFWGYQIVARLKDGVTLEQAAQDADRVAQQTMQSFPPSRAAIRIRGDVQSLREYTVGEIRPLLRTLFLAVCVVLAIACANVAGLMLVRAIRRRREYAVRLALGAPWSAIAGESVCEGLLLSAAGGALGLGLAAAAIQSVVRWLPESMPRVDAISMNATVAGFALLLAVATGALCSLAPAFAALRVDVAQSLQESTRSNTGGASHVWLRTGLMVAEVAIALALLTVSGAFLRSLQKMQTVDPGFRADYVAVARYQLPVQQYPSEPSVHAFRREVAERLSRKPGVLQVGLINSLPASGLSARAAYTLEGQRAEGWKLKFAAFAMTYGDYFETMGIRLIEGRYFTERDRDDAPLVVIVNELMAKDCWPGQSAIGKRLHVGNPQNPLPWATVIGVVADTKIGSRDEESDEQWYLPVEQPSILYGTRTQGALQQGAAGYVALRSALPAEQMTQTLRSTIAEIDPLLALDPVEAMDEAVANVEAPRRFNTELIGSFAIAAVLLAVTGIYAVVAFSVSQRTQEIAVRVAVGAQRRDIARLVLISGAKIAAVGCVIGVAGAAAVSRIVNAFLFQVSGTDPVIYGAGVVVMVLLALAASAIPAARAAAADPNEALRSM